MNTRFFLSVILISVFFTNCRLALNRKVKYDGLTLNLTALNAKSIDIALLDHREAVTNGSQGPDFVGYAKSRTGISWPMKTRSKNALMVDLSTDIVSSFEKSGVKVTNVNTKYNDDKDEVKLHLLNLAGDKKIVLVFDQLHTDGYGAQYLNYKLTLYLYDSAGQLLRSKVMIGREKIGGTVLWGSGRFKTYMPAAMIKLLEDIFKEALPQ
ncbi:MAG: hypothetical protein V4580_06525 [Bacteroidota bacterium]